MITSNTNNFRLEFDNEAVEAVKAFENANKLILTVVNNRSQSDGYYIKIEDVETEEVTIWYKKTFKKSIALELQNELAVFIQNNNTYVDIELDYKRN